MQLSKTKIILPRFYRNFALIFFILGLALIFLLGYYTLGQAEIIITPYYQDVDIERVVNVRDLSLETTTDVENEVSGKVAFLEAEDVKTYPATGTREETTDVVGQVTIVNNYSKDQPLVASTRLLSPEGVLVRIKDDVVVPAGGQVTAWVYPDKPEEFTEINPTKLTIPGLWAGLQDKIYGGNKEVLKKGARKIKVVTEEDLKRAEEDLADYLAKKASDEISESLTDEAVFYSKLIKKEIISTEPGAVIGASSDEFTVKMKIRVVVIAFDEIKLLNIIREKMAANSSAGSEVIDTEGIVYEVDSYDLAGKTASIKAKAKGKSIMISDEGGPIDKSLLSGMSKQEVINYLSQFKEIQNIEVNIQPSWILKMPKNPDRIEIIVR